jgi:hypothetical protein
MSTTRRKPYPTEEPVTAEELLESSPFEGDLDAELAARPEGRRMSTATMALCAGVLLVVGMLAGIQAQKAWGSPAGGQAGPAALLAGGGAQRTGAGPGAGGYLGGGQGRGQGQQGQGAGNGALGNVTVGTIKLVDGSKIYLETVAAGVVTVTTTGDTKVQVSKQGKLKDLKPGSTVIVQGERAGDGSVSATSVNQGGATGGAGGARGGG